MSVWKCCRRDITSPVSLCFNPCSFGCQSESTGGGIWKTIYTSCFNPCSFGCQSERKSLRVGPWRNIRVSILVLLDVSLKEIPHIVPRNMIPAVSILVLLDVSLKVWARHRLWCFSHVSILVLLDVSLKATIPWSLNAVRFSFNPCSFGCQSERGAGDYWVEMPRRFQSLFFWMSVWKNHWGSVRDEIFVFQSLFFWMSVWKQVMTAVTDAVITGFNPCSFGCQSERLFQTFENPG